MDEEYDAIVLGTGLKECIISGLLSVSGMKVLHMDRNNYYGGESASLNLNQLYEQLRPGAPKPPAELGPSRDYNVDMVPKFMMANGKLVKTLIYTDVTKYLEFKAVDGSYVLNKGRVHKVPASDYEALRSPLMGLFEKRRARLFFIYVQNYNPSDPSTHQGLDLTRLPMAALYNHFGLDPQTVDFVGHALALYRDDEYLVRPALETVLRVKLYHDSLARYDGLTSPYIYPRYGLGELPQAFARLSAVYGGTYMLAKEDARVVYDEATGLATGVASGGETARARIVVGDPSYFPQHTKATSRVARALCILSHPIPGTDDSHSAQIILPQKQISRPSDTYVFCCSYAHAVAPRGKWLAFVSSAVDPRLAPDAPVNAEAELAPGLALLGAVDEKFFTVTEVREPVAAGAAGTAGAAGAGAAAGGATPPPANVFISKGYDATTHFETTVDDVLELYARITGKQLDLDAPRPVRAAGGGGGGGGGGEDEAGISGAAQAPPEAAAPPPPPPPPPPAAAPAPAAPVAEAPAAPVPPAAPAAPPPPPPPAAPVASPPPPPAVPAPAPPAALDPLGAAPASAAAPAPVAAAAAAAPPPPPPPPPPPSDPLL